MFEYQGPQKYQALTMELQSNTFDLRSLASTGTISSILDEPSIVSFVHTVLLSALKKRASDVHLEPYNRGYRIRFRIDGILTEEARPPLSLANRISSRIKVLSHLDISERRLPQDGRFSLALANREAVDIRVSICPTSFGEKVVLRILDSHALPLSLDYLGLTLRQKTHFSNALNKPQGMVLVTGPTGSGKTSTLYAALSQLNTDEVNIVSIEDPIEITMPGVNQVAIHPKIGLTFTSLMQAFLRQDPDIIMLGEMRSLETAKIAFAAAETGHLVLSTLHSNSAAETVTRLLNMGVSPFQMAHTIHLIIAQRLVRKLCTQCKILDNTLMIYKARGCAHCIQGYQGRIGIFEAMPLSKSILGLIASQTGPSGRGIHAQAQKEGMLSLYQSGMALVKQGITSLEEVQRICGRP